MEESTKSLGGNFVKLPALASLPLSSMDDIENEIALACGIYEDALIRDPDDPFTLSFRLPFELLVSISFPKRGYPGAQGLQFVVMNAPNAVLCSRFQQCITKVLQSDLALQEEEGNVLLLALPLLMSSAEEFEKKILHEREEVRQKNENEKESIAEVAESMQQDEQKMTFFQSKPIVDRKSKFIAHLVPVQSVDDVHNAVQFLRHQKDIAIAHHPAMWAYRYVDPASGRLCSGMYDDGETGASSRILFVMESLQVEGWLVAVTRWFGGILLGSDRFKHIMSVTRDVITSCPALQKRP